MSAPLPPYTPLQKIAEKAEQATGLHAEIIGGVIMMSPTPRGKHGGAIVRIRKQLEAAMPDALTVMEVTSVGTPVDPDDYAIPDLVVLPVEWEDCDEWLADPTDAELVVEVVSKGNHSKDLTHMPGWYASALIPLYLLIDPRHGTWLLHSSPGSGRYQQADQGKFGEAVSLPEPFGFPLETGHLPVYGESPSGGR